MTGHEAYSVLELEYGDSLDAVKKAYRSLALRYHPDRNPGLADAEEKFKLVSDAYMYLQDYPAVGTKTDAGHAEKENVSAANALVPKNESRRTTGAVHREASFAYHHNYHERYKNGEFGERAFKKRNSC